MYFVYILESERNGKYYIGQTEKLEARLERHNAGRNKSTKSGRPWKIKYWKEFQTRSEVIIAERKLKSLKSRNLIIRYAKDNEYRGIAQPGSDKPQSLKATAHLSRILEKFTNQRFVFFGNSARS